MPDVSPDTAIGTPPSPNGGWSGELVELRGAHVVPPAVSGLVQECGVLTSAGHPCPHSVTWRGHRPTMTPPPKPDETARLEGRYVYAGQLWAHFGHFLTESLARIWALGRLRGKLDGIVFIPKRPAAGQTPPKAYQREFLSLLGIDLPVIVLDRPTTVERLVVPGQGFGLGPISQGTKPFREYFARNFAPDIAPNGPERLYLSRSALGGLEGGAVLEEVLEGNLAQSGYATYHPQQHGIAEQVAAMRAASHVVGLDGSAFHLLAYAAPKEQRKAIILRRNSTVFKSLANQLAHFTGEPADVFRAVRADWIPASRNRPGRYSFGQLDFEVLARALNQAGYIGDWQGWQIPRFRDFKRAMRQFGEAKGLEYVHVKKGRPRGEKTGAAE